MFVSHDMKSKKKPKPNILRRKPVPNKSSVVHKSDKPESQNVQSLLAPSFELGHKSNVQEEQKSENCDNIGCTIERLVPKVEIGLCNTQQVVENSEKNSLIYFNTVQQNDNECSQNQIVSVGPLFVGDVINQNVPVFENGNLLQNKDKENQARETWCFIENPETIIIKQVDNTEAGLIGYVSDRPVEPLVEPDYAQEQAQLTNVSTTYKCNISNCNKEFLTKQKLRNHTSVHNKSKVGKPQKQTTSECPVKRFLEDGAEVPCGRMFLTKEDLMKHLNEEHTIDEAHYGCSECGRRFFWASGLRAHARAHAAGERASLACPWPGCGRMFRQPCRLREHARSHTGDRPYPCSYPNCGWSFRTASKLLRHARRHTGERRHACAACGRAFLRREHLRDHTLRHAAPSRRAKHVCPSLDCQHSFSNMSSLYMHLKKVHKTVDDVPPAAVASNENGQKTRIKSENMFVVSLLEPSESPSTEHVTVEVKGEDDTLKGEREVGTAEEEGHSARTHCTWPLARAPPYQPSDEYVLEEDVQVEQSEGSESNIYTVRSDLFLHGNVLHNEDSEQMVQCAGVSEGEGEGEGEGEVGAPRADALALDADLLLDAPSVHFDQEELYTDAVDESSFRVFLLSGEELV